MLETLVALVIALRPEWTPTAIREAVTKIAGRGAPAACYAMIAVATDPQSRHPNRVTVDGWWWHPNTTAVPVPDKFPRLPAPSPEVAVRGIEKVRAAWAAQGQR